MACFSESYSMSVGLSKPHSHISLANALHCKSQQALHSETLTLSINIASLLCCLLIQRPYSYNTLLPHSRPGSFLVTFFCTAESNLSGAAEAGTAHHIDISCVKLTGQDLPNLCSHRTCCRHICGDGHECFACAAGIQVRSSSQLQSRDHPQCCCSHPRM